MAPEICVIQVSNIAPNTSLEQMQTLFGYIGEIREIRMYPKEENVSQQSSKICYVKYSDPTCVAVSQHLTNTVFIDRALLVSPATENEIPDETTAMASNTNILSGSNSGVVSQVVTGAGGTQVITTIDPRLVALGLPQYPPLPANMDPNKIEEIRRTVYVGNLDSSITAEQLLKFFNQIGEVKYVRMAGDEHQPTRFAFIEFTEQSSVANALQYNGVILGGRPLKINHSNNSIVKPQAKSNESAQKEIDEAMKRVREAQTLIHAAIEAKPANDTTPVVPTLSASQEIKKKSKSRSRSRDMAKEKSRSRSSSRSRRRSRSRGRRSISRDRRGWRDRSRERRRSSRERYRVSKSRSRSRSRDKRHRRVRRSLSRERDFRRKRSRSRDRTYRMSRRIRRSRSKSHSRTHHRYDEREDRERFREREKDRERDHGHERDRDKEREVERERNRDKEREIERERPRDKDRERNREERYSLKNINRSTSEEPKVEGPALPPDDDFETQKKGAQQEIDGEDVDEDRQSSKKDDDSFSKKDESDKIPEGPSTPPLPIEVNESPQEERYYVPKSPTPKQRSSSRRSRSRSHSRTEHHKKKRDRSRSRDRYREKKRKRKTRDLSEERHREYRVVRDYDEEEKGFSLEREDRRYRRNSPSP